jgi:tetratricopeptide (TPR) repeat protein
MESALTATGRTRTLGARWSLDSGALGAWLLPVALVTYLGMRSGGYDVVISDQVGIALWWLVFLTFTLRLTSLRLTAAARIGLGLLVVYAGWTASSLIWTESAERTMGDVTLMLLYVALALLAFAIRGREAARLMLGGLAVAIVAIATIALLSRLHFAWFAVPEVAQTLPTYAHKLSYPLGYWNALAALMAIGIPLLLHAATGARAMILRALAGGGVPILALCAFLTVSRGGAIAAVLGVLVFLALAPDRLPKLAVALVCGGGSALLVAAANQRPAVRDGLRSALAAHQGDQLIAIAAAVAIGVAFVVYAIALLERHVERPRLLVLSRARVGAFAGAAVVVALAVFLAAGGPGFLSREWTQFKTPRGPTSLNSANALQRLQDVTGNGRYQLWQAAMRAGDAHPLTGTGAGTFVYWWARDGTLSGGFVQDTHSLYLQAFAELGYPGLVLISSFILWILVCGVVKAVRVRDPDRRLAIAAATAGGAVFAFSAAVEWIWLIPVLPAALIVLAAVIFAPEDSGAASVRRSPSIGLRAAVARAAASSWARGAARIAGGLAALAALVAIALPMSATAAVRDSQASARAGNVAAALTTAREAVRLQPYAATPWLQEALVLELAGDLRGALIDAARATSREPTNSNTWLVRSRLEARTGHARAALEAYRRARSLNPNSPVFAP